MRRLRNLIGMLFIGLPLAAGYAFAGTQADSSGVARTGTPDIPLGTGSRVMIREVDFHGDAGKYRSEFLSMIKQALQAAGVSIVATPEEVRRASQQRREDRENPEVQQATVPPPATIIRETADVSLSLTLTRSDKDTQALLGTLSRRFPILGGFSVKKKTTNAIITMSIWDNETQQSNNELMVAGGENDTTDLIVGIVPVIARNKRSDQEDRDLKAIAAAADKLSRAIRTQTIGDGKAVRGTIINIADGYIIVNLGSNNGIAVGSEFRVTPVVVTGNVRTRLPAVATLRVVSVDGNSSACGVIDGERTNVAIGSEVELVDSTPAK